MPTLNHAFLHPHINSTGTTQHLHALFATTDGIHIDFCHRDFAVAIALSASLSAVSAFLPWHHPGGLGAVAKLEAAKLKA